MVKLRSNILALILAAIGTQGFTASQEAAQAIEVPQMVPAEEPKHDLDLQRWSTATFHQDLVNVIQSLNTAHGAEQIDVLLDAAELYLTHMLLFEASSTLEGIEPQTPERRRRHQMLSHATQLLAGKAPADFTASPLAAPDRHDRAFWISLHAIATGDLQTLNANIEQSFAGLGRQSRAVLRAMLPVFTEAAIEMGREEYVTAALRLMQELPDLAKSSTGLFLRGRAEERRGNASSALESYFMAAGGWDQYAARARLAVADMALDDGGRGALLAAQNTLEDGTESWRGNRYELELLKRLARINAATENDIEALLTLGKLLARFPRTPEAEIALVQSQETLAKVYHKGGEGAYSLAGWMEFHLRLIPFFRYTPGFARHTEGFGDFVLELGSTDLAIEEYRRAIHLLQNGPEASSKASATDLFRVNIKLATAQMRAGLAKDALITLDMMPPPTSGSNRDIYAMLKAKVTTQLSDPPAFVETYVAAPTAEHLRSQGLALAEEGLWARSNDVFLQLWGEHPQEFTVRDATRLLIAANRSNNAETVSNVARAFPSLTKSKALIKLAESLHSELPLLLPLRAEKVDERLERLEKTFERINNSNIFP